MDTALERIQAKIVELEAKIGDLRIAERELKALEKISTRRTPTMAPAPRRRRGPKPALPARAGRKSKAIAPVGARQTIGSAIAETLEQHGALSAAAISEHIKASGRDINNRTVSFSLQALKKRGLVRNEHGSWTLASRARRGRPLPGGQAEEIGAAS